MINGRLHFFFNSIIVCLRVMKTEILFTKKTCPYLLEFFLQLTNFNSFHGKHTPSERPAFVCLALSVNCHPSIHFISFLERRGTCLPPFCLGLVLFWPGQAATQAGPSLNRPGQAKVVASCYRKSTINRKGVYWQ